MQRSVKLFGWVAGLGTIPFFLFGVLSVFQPDILSVTLGVEFVEFSYVWIANLGMLSLVWTIYSFPVAGRPDRYRLFAWGLTLGHLLLSVYWGIAVAAPDQRVFLGFFATDAVLLVLQAILLFVGPAEMRPTPANVRDEIAQLRLARAGENRWWTWFRRLVWVGIVTNLVGFCIPGLFAPQFLARTVGAGQTAFSGIWLGSVAVILLTATVMYLPCAIGPQRYPVYAWIMSLNRLAMGIFWFNVWRTPYQEGFLGFFASDFGYGVVLTVLLALAYRADRHPVWDAFTAVRPVAAMTLMVVGLVAMGGVAVGSEVRPAAAPQGVQGDSPENHYKYGTIGMSISARVPYWVWRALPVMFPEHLPDPARGVESLGLLFEEGKDLPIGFSRRDEGYPTIEPNCALCHTGSVRAAPGAPRQILIGAPAGSLDLQAFQTFLYRSAADPRFTPENVVAAIEKEMAKSGETMSATDRLMYRWAVVPMTKSALLKQRDDYAWQHSRPPQGRGRTDTFNPTKINVFHMADDGTIGTTDLPQIWNQELRRDMWLHWDGNNNKLENRNLAAAMAVGATPRSVILPSFQRVFDFALGLKPPAYPFPVDAAKVQAGQAIYAANCQACHSFGAPNVGQVTPIEEVATDRHRLDSFTQGLVDRFHLVEEYPFRFEAYRKTQGYTNTPLDGVWARAPYLHHGAVPTLWDLLQTPDKRPAVFWRGYDVYDPVKLGFVTSGPDAEREGWRYDTSVRGNGNGGHLYGTTLTDDEKWALIEYMKTM